MSKKTKQNTRDRRRQEKRNQKVAQKAKYAAFAEKGVNEKSRRKSISNKAEKYLKMRAHCHPDGPCGNLGCKKCFPQHSSVEKQTFQSRFLNYLYPQAGY